MKILFLEDEMTIQEVLTEYMKMQKYHVCAVSDGEAAIQLLESTEFDLAVLDIMVPKISGLEVLRYIRENKFQLATIMLTALEDEQTQIKAFNLFADDYVIKPVSPIILLKRMEAILRRTKRQGKIEERDEGLCIYEDSYQAFYNGEDLQLTLSEFILLHTLHKEYHRVFTREQLIMKIFNEDYIGNDRIIDAHVKNVRKKLPRKYIKTIIGVGYQFNSEV